MGLLTSSFAPFGRSGRHIGPAQGEVRNFLNFWDFRDFLNFNGFWDFQDYWEFLEFWDFRGEGVPQILI